MSAISIILSLLILVISVVLIGIILMQKKNISAGFNSVNLGGMGGTQTYWDKNKGRSMEGQLAFYTKILAAVFMILCFVSCLIK